MFSAGLKANNGTFGVCVLWPRGVLLAQKRVLALVCKEKNGQRLSTKRRCGVMGEPGREGRRERERQSERLVCKRETCKFALLHSSGDIFGFLISVTQTPFLSSGLGDRTQGDCQREGSVGESLALRAVNTLCGHDETQVSFDSKPKAI